MQGDWFVNIVIMGAGAIGTLFGAMLSKDNNVILIGRKPHIETIRKSGLNISGKTNLSKKIKAVISVDEVDFTPDLLILTVKSYDTETAIKQAKKIIKEDKLVLSLQNGLGNVEKIKKVINSENIIAGITTDGALFLKPGHIVHTGKSSTIIGRLDGSITKQIESIVNIFNKAGFKTTFSKNIAEELWIKAIVNSSINPLTTIFQCKNGYLLENPILEKLVEKICKESIKIANSKGIKLSFENIIRKTKEVIEMTAENNSSMLQSKNKGKKTEIDSINGVFVDIAKKNKTDSTFNSILYFSVKNL